MKFYGSVFENMKMDFLTENGWLQRPFKCNSLFFEASLISRRRKMRLEQTHLMDQCTKLYEPFLQNAVVQIETYFKFYECSSLNY